MPEEIHATNEIDINVEIDDKRTAESQDIDTATKDLITDMKGGSKGGGMGMGLDLPLAFGGIEGAKQATSSNYYESLTKNGIEGYSNYRRSSSCSRNCTYDNKRIS
jgi:hypothetical protein